VSEANASASGTGALWAYSDDLGRCTVLSVAPSFNHRILLNIAI
jgi:hypothetical protein